MKMFRGSRRPPNSSSRRGRWPPRRLARETLGAPGAPRTIVLLHGLYMPVAWMRELARCLMRADAVSTRVVSMQAPWRRQPYLSSGGGHSWYVYRTDRHCREADEVDHASLLQSVGQVLGELRFEAELQLRAGHRPHLILVGYSQGACLCHHLAALQGLPCAGAICIYGHPPLGPVLRYACPVTSILSRTDDVIPWSWAASMSSARPVLLSGQEGHDLHMQSLEPVLHRSLRFFWSSSTEKAR